MPAEAVPLPTPARVAAIAAQPTAQSQNLYEAGGGRDDCNSFDVAMLKPTKQQRQILVLLANGGKLTRASLKGTWFDSVNYRWFNIAACQWLLDEGLIELAGSSPQFESFQLSESGLAIVAEQLPDRERMAA